MATKVEAMPTISIHTCSMGMRGPWTEPTLKVHPASTI